MSLTAALVTFGIIFVAELPDKTLVASLVLGSRFRPLHVWFGAAAAFLVHVTLAVAVGSVFSLLPHRVVAAVVLVLFVIGAVLILREGGADEEHEEAAVADAVDAASAGGGAPAETGEVSLETGEVSLEAQAGAVATRVDGQPEPATGGSRGFWKVAATSFTVIFLAEMGDLTQISTANLAARFSSPLSVWLGAVLALWAVAAIAIAGGRSLLRVVPVKIISRIAAAAFVILAVFSLIDLIKG